ncbi:transglycosylase, partial [Acinetobacter baumannii]|nr:transglycosylase [Acinetobacter baumannii]
MPNLPFYDRQVTTQGLGPGPVDLPNNTIDQQMLNAGADAAARATASITRQVSDTALQDGALKLDTIKYNLFNQVRQKQGQNAIGSSDDALQQYDQAAGTLGQTIPEGRREDWNRQVSATRLQLQSSADSHEYQQFQDYSRGQLDGRLQMAVHDAETY